MEPEGTEGYNKAYLQRVYQSLLKTGNNISLAELNTAAAEVPMDSTSQSNVLSVANQTQIRQTVKVIQSNGSPRGETSKSLQTVSGTGQHGAVSLLQKQHGKESSIMGYRKKQPISNRGRKHPGGVARDPYYHKWKYLKKYVKNMVFMNAAICDEVVRQEEKVARAREERRFLLRKYLHYQAAAETPTGKLGATSILKSATGEELLAGGGKSKAKKKGAAQTGDKAKQTRDMLESLGVKSKPKKSKVAGGKHIVPPIPLDNAGRPMFPLVLGDLTLYSIGEIVPDRPGFHTSNSIFPVGYCSTRVYANISNPDKQCLYTCKISDGGNGPMFEIVPEDDTKTFKSRFLSECHSQLLRALNQARGIKLVETTGKGPDFFGLSHPVVQNLIQSCPGAKKCNGYKWVKFEVNKNLTMDSMPVMSEDPTISHSALKLKVAGVLDQSPSNLRTLLAGSVMDSSLLNT